MQVYIPISLKRIAVQKLAEVETGRLTREKAEQAVRDQCSYSSRTREQIVEGLTRCYDPESVRAFELFKLI